MKQNRTFITIFTLLAVMALTLAACAPKDSGPVTLSISGLVDTPLSLTDAGLQERNVVTITAEHPKNGPTEYSGIYLNDLLEDAGIQAGATTVVLMAGDGYSYEVDLATVQACSDCLITFTDEVGVYNAVMPGLESKAWVKNITSIEFK